MEEVADGVEAGLFLEVADHALENFGGGVDIAEGAVGLAGGDAQATGDVLEVVAVEVELGAGEGEGADPGVG